MDIKSPALVLGLAALAGASPAAAQDTGDWVWQLTPYVWATGIDGDITPFTGAPTVSFDSSFSEVLKDLDAAFFLSGYARRDRFVLLGDLSYSASSKEGVVPPGAPATGKLEQTSLTLAAGYRVVAEDGLALDLLAGARHWRIKGSVDVPLAGLSASPTLSFTDPIIALRANVQIAPQWSAILYGDIGGFGVGSERTGQVVATVNYQLRDDVFLSAGYRALSLDYRDGGTRIDATMSGPIFGATWRF
ncbi:outer membrane beta-barrel protein [Rhodobacter sp. SGA-6-6]|uniref:outer membrane beta-barrel protein n=1 Tax=Rhodobacter sp. SGA-6-6 TaxID=2710882 RepID=UPI0013EB33BF|nr:outer membrane beta-barrel protein [Rhodobacter sp. SGA-6-6]NGM46050.1 outer membrane beta-barrel protein [Rhodobacter sp. SGA-6-6]